MNTANQLDTLDVSDAFELQAKEMSEKGGFQAGDLISHNIRLVHLLGAGGMGNVWLADHTGLETQVAVKFMSKELASDLGLVARFGREAKLVARIKSPHVVQIFDFATTPGGIPFIVMELLEGEDLESRIRRRELTLEETSRVFIQVCKALAKAHALGIVHRDIKPDNIFLIEDDGDIFAKIVDFGIAKDDQQAPGITVSGTTMGTPSYMSPEQLFHPKDVDIRSDLWSVAVVAYRCLTGHLPFAGDSFGAVCVAINGGNFVPPSADHPHLPSGFDGWFEKALSRKLEDRFQSIAEMSNEYLAVLEKAKLLPNWAEARHSKGEHPNYSTDPGGISGGIVSMRPPEQRRRHPFGLVASLLCVAALVLGALLVFSDDAREAGRKWLPASFSSLIWPTDPPSDPHMLPAVSDQGSVVKIPVRSSTYAEKDVARPTVEPRKIEAHEPSVREHSVREPSLREPSVGAPVGTSETAPAPSGQPPLSDLPQAPTETSPNGI